MELQFVEMGKPARQAGLGAEISGSVSDVVSLRCLLLVCVEMALGIQKRSLREGFRLGYICGSYQGRCGTSRSLEK